MAETANALEALRVETGQLPPDARIVVRWNELVEVWQRGSRLSEQIQRRDLGKIAEKAVAVEVLARQCQNAVAALHAEVESEAIRVRNQLRASLEAVQVVAPFDLENAVRSAQRANRPHPRRFSTPVAIPPCTASRIGLSKST